MIKVLIMFCNPNYQMWAKEAFTDLAYQAMF